MGGEKPTRSKLVYPTEPREAQQAVEAPGSFVTGRSGWNAGQLGDLVLFISRRWGWVGVVSSLVTLNQGSSDQGWGRWVQIHLKAGVGLLNENGSRSVHA